MRGATKRKPVVPVSFVEEQLLRRTGGTAARCLAKGFSLPQLLDDAYTSCQGGGFVHRLGGWLRGRRGPPREVLAVGRSSALS